MRSKCRSCVQCTLKVLNSILTVVGVAMILHSLWILRKWYSQLRTMPFIQETGAHLPCPWFIYTFLSMGIILCFITFSGHVVAETANSLSLSIYIFSVCLLLFLQGGFAAYVILKKNWESDIPEDPTGQLDKLKEFLRTNFDICSCVGLFVLVVQALNVFLALILCALGSDLARDHDSENDFSLLRSDLKQSFLIRPDSLPTVNPEPQLGQIDNHGIDVSEFLNNQVD